MPLTNRFTRIRDSIESRMLTTTDDKTRHICQTLIREWNHGRIAAQEWLKLEDPNTLDTLIQQSPAEPDWSTLKENLYEI